jgi:hypothetical protein
MANAATGFLGRGALAAALALLSVFPVQASEPVVLDDFETLDGWTAVGSEGAHVELAQDTGHNGLGMRIDFDLSRGAGYVIARKKIAIPLPQDYAFTFQLRGQASPIRLEFKVIAPDGQNIWWHQQGDLEFPQEWRRMSVKKWQLRFAWGPSGGGTLDRMGSLELAIAGAAGSKGSVWIDDLQFKERQPPAVDAGPPPVTASTSRSGHEPQLALDNEPATSWRSADTTERQWLLVDLQERREYGALVIDWHPEDYATTYTVETSDDGEGWRPAYVVTGGNGRRDYIYLPDSESRYVRLDLQASSSQHGYGIRNLQVKPPEFSASINQFFTEIAAGDSRGLYPKYLYGEQSYWTVIGASEDDKEGLLNEEGALEVDKGAFTIEPFLYVDDALVTWNDVTLGQELEEGYLPIPSVIWHRGGITLRITAYATGRPGASTLYARYRVENHGAEPQQVGLFLAIRPFQVNPPWQSLNMEGGASPIRKVTYDGQSIVVNNSKSVVPLTRPERFGAATFDQGPVTDYLLQRQVPPQTSASDSFGYGSAALEYRLDVPAGGVRDVHVAAPFHGLEVPYGGEGPGDELARTQLEAAASFWREELDGVGISLPPVADHLSRAIKSNLAYILINRDGPAIQPGSRCYSRSWIRDGALTSAALLSMGHTAEVREFVDWFSRFQFPDGKIPCCIDARGADPVAEHDSNGEFVYAVMEYYRYTRDVGFLKRMWPRVVKAVEYIDFLRSQRTTEAYKTPETLPFYGLVPESISHEGYSAHPVHSYWDNFFALRGLKDAATMAAVLGDQDRAVRYARLRDEFTSDLYASIARTLAKHGTRYIPGSVELGDFDATATTIAVVPGGELPNLPAPNLVQTFDDYWQHFEQRRADDFDWQAYTPYEVRTVGTFVRLGRRDRAVELLDFFWKGIRPAAWNGWAEIVWRDQKAPRFIGDMPHTWVGSDFIRAVRSMLAFENEADRSLVIAAGIPWAWVENDGGISVKRLPTYYGTLAFHLRRTAPDELRLSMSGDLSVPPGKLVLEPPLPQPLKAVTVNGRPLDSFEAGTVTTGEFPADVVMRF